MNAHRVLARPGRHAIVCGTLCCVLAVTGLTALVAAAVWIAGLPDDARQQLGFGFDGPSSGAAAGIKIAIHNAQLAGAALVGAALAPRLAWVASVLDILLGGLLLANVGFLGVAFGGYGARLLAATWPHLPFELAAFSLAGGGYFAARAGRLTSPALAAAAALVGVLLVGGGLVEATISNPR